MRIFTNFEEAFSEIKRDLGEMGVEIHTKTMQNKNIEGNDDYSTKELQFYSYRILDPLTSNNMEYLLKSLPNKEWALMEWIERRTGIEENPVNPGEAYKLREGVWNEFLNKDGKFDYTYSERFARNQQVLNVIKALKNDPMSRQAYITVWDSADSNYLGTAISRVPCSLGYLFQYRQGKLNLEYNMRSCDFGTHFKNDIYEALMLLGYVSGLTGLPAGDFIHHIASFHIYKKDIADVF